MKPGDEVFAVHITRLLDDGSDRRRDQDEDGKERGNKITIGAPLGSPIALAAITDSLTLALCEGIEDALAYHAAGFSAWAAGAAGYLPALASRIPLCIETVIVERHPDPAAYFAASELEHALLARKVPPEIIIREAAS